MVATAYKRLIWFAIPLVIVAAYALFSSSREAQGKIAPGDILRVGIDPTVPPFAAIVDDAFQGFEVELAKAIGTKLGTPVQFVIVNYDSRYDALINNQVDCVVAMLAIDMSKTADVAYSRPYYDDGLLLVSMSQTYDDLATELQGQSVAFAYGSEADTTTRQWQVRIEGLERRPYEFASSALDAMRLGDADTALVDATTYYLYEDESDFQITRVSSVPYAIAVAKDRPGLAQQINSVLDDFMSDGTLSQMIESWF